MSQRLRVAVRIAAGGRIGWTASAERPACGYVPLAEVCVSEVWSGFFLILCSGLARMRLSGAPVPCLRMRVGRRRGLARWNCLAIGQRPDAGRMDAATPAPSQQRENVLRRWEKQP